MGRWVGGRERKEGSIEGERMTKIRCALEIISGVEKSSERKEKGRVKRK